MGATKIISGKGSNMGTFGKPNGKAKVSGGKKGYKK